MNKMKTKKMFQNVTLPLTLFLLGTTFILFWSSGWLVYEWLKISKEKDLGEKLISIGKTSTYIFNQSALLLLDEDLLNSLDYSPTFTNLINSIKSVTKENNLRSMIILNKKGEVLIDPQFIYSVGEKFEKIIIDITAWEKALAGIPAASDYYFFKNSPFKSAYIPIKDENGLIIAIFRIEANRNYFSSLYLLANFLLWIGIIISLVLLFISLRVSGMVKNILKSEEAMAVADRFQSLGTLSAGLAHELRNPLGIIQVTTDVLKTELKEDEQKKLADDIIEEVKRMNALLTQFLHFSKTSSDTSELKTISLVPLLNTLISLLQKSVKNHKIKISLNYEIDEDDNVIDVLGEEKGLRQVFINLILNAVDAISDKEGYVNINVSDNKKKVFVDIIDNGCGIAYENSKRIFDPFFTTKQSGTGLGLTVSKKIIEGFGGSIEVNSNKDVGTTVRVILVKPN